MHVTFELIFWNHSKWWWIAEIKNQMSSLQVLLVGDRDEKFIGKSQLIWNKHWASPCSIVKVTHNPISPVCLSAHAPCTFLLFKRFYATLAPSNHWPNMLGKKWERQRNCWPERANDLKTLANLWNRCHFQHPSSSTLTLHTRNIFKRDEILKKWIDGRLLRQM